MPSSEQMLESVLIQVVSEVLALEKQEIDPEENLSEYGFDSIVLAEFAAKIVRLYPFMKLEPSTFLELPTLSKLASFLGTKYKTDLLNAAESAVSMSELPGGQKLSTEQLMPEIGSAKADPNDVRKVAPPFVQEMERAESDVAIIGIAGRFPGAENVGELWKNLVEEKSLFTKVPPERWDWEAYYGDPQVEGGKTDCCYGAFLHDVDRFDPIHFGISPAEAELLDPQHRLLLEVAWETVENAGYRKSTLHNRRVGVFVGVEKQDYKELINKSCFELDPHTNAGNTHSMLANRISYFFNWRGPSVAVDTACSSSLTAIGQACDSLRGNRVEMALAGGINLLLTPWIFVVNRKLGMLTNESVMRSFDQRAAGHLNGEGVGLVLLKKLSSAIADNDIIYGVIRAVSVQHGGRGVFLTAPNPDGHKSVVEDALSEADLEAKDINYIEAQGTADPASDKVELKTYQAVFGGSSAEPVRIGTAKGNIGHLGAASGVTALIKTVLSFRNNKLPRVLNLENLNWTSEDGEFQCKFVSRTQEWSAQPLGSSLIPRRAAVHNFGYGGVNVHAIVEEYFAASTPEAEPIGPSVIVLSARTQEQLMQYAGNLLTFIRNRDFEHYGIKELQLPALAYTLQVGREPMEYRLAIVADNLGELEQKLDLLGHAGSKLEMVFSGKTQKRKNAQHRISQQIEGHDPSLAGSSSADTAVEFAKSWVSGEEINWTELYSRAKPQKIPLPTYPFARERYWIPQSSDGPNVYLNGHKRNSIYMPHEESLDHHNNPALERLVTRDLKRQICSLLKMKPDQLGERAAFVELGFSSLTLAQLARNVSGLFDISLLPPAFFSYPSVDQLTGYLVQSHRPSLESFYKLNTDAVLSERQNMLLPTPEVAGRSTQSTRASNPTARLSPSQDEPIAVIGMSGRFPGADSTSELWSTLAAGKSVISEIPKERWDWREYYRGPGDAWNQIATNRGGFISGVAEFDPVFFNLSPREAELIDPRQRLLLQEAWRAFEDAGYAGRHLRGKSCGVFIGVEEGEYEKLTADDGLITGNHNGVLASRISYLLDLRGPSLAINAACSSGLVAVHLACQSLQRGETEMALAGAVNLLLFPGIYQHLTRMGMLSESGQCFAFDERADGMVPGEAVAVLVLKRLSSAIEDGDNIYGVIKGCGLNYKGKTNGMTAPSGLSQKRLIEDIYQRCGLQAGDIDYVAAHGTGTKLGDPVEVAALTEAFRASTSKTGYCTLGSISPYLGHTFAVSGIVSMIAVLLGMKNNTIPPSLNCEKRNEFLSLSDSPFYISKIAAPWIPQPGKKRLAAVSAFGISGTNAHVVLEEHAPLVAYESGTKARDKNSRTVIVPLSARNEEQLRKYVENISLHLESAAWQRVPSEAQGFALGNLGYTLQVGRDAMEYRVAFVVSDSDELARSLRNFLEESSADYYGRAHNDLAIVSTMGSDEDMRETIRRWRSKGKLRNIAALWVAGAEIDWEILRYGDETRVSLPTYPFAKRTCWFHLRKSIATEAAPSSLGATEKREQVAEIPNLTFAQGSSTSAPFPIPDHQGHEGTSASGAAGNGGNGASHEKTAFGCSVQSHSSGSRENDSGRVGALPTLDRRLQFDPHVRGAKAKAEPKANGSELNLRAIERELKAHVSEALYLDESEIECGKKFVDMGLDSVIGVELVNRLNKHFNLKMSATRFYDYPTIMDLGRFIYEILTERGNEKESSFPCENLPNGKSRAGLGQADSAAGSIEERVRDVLKQLAANTLTPDQAEQVIANGFQGLSSTN